MNEILIRKAKKGDKDAFCRLIDENVQSMYKVAAAYLKCVLKISEEAFFIQRL